MRFYPIELMENAIKELESEIKKTEKECKDEKYFSACKYVNETRIIQLKSAITFLTNAENIPIVSE